MNEQELAILQEKIQKMLDECEWMPPVLCSLGFPEEQPETVLFQGQMVQKEHRDFYMLGYKNPCASPTHVPDEWKSVFYKGQDAAKWEDGMESTF